MSELIATATALGLFRVTSAKSITDRMAILAEELDQDEISVEQAEILNDERIRLREEKIAKEKARAEKAAAKAAKEAAKPLAVGAEKDAHIVRFPAGRYVLSCAQNNTEVDAAFMQSLERFAEDKGARILIGKSLYNKGAFAQPGLDNVNEDVYFVDAVKPYLVEGLLDLGGVYFHADANVIPTAAYPISGFEGVSPAEIDVIVPAVKLQMAVTPALKGRNPKRICASGAVTKRNYILRKAGAVASATHSIAAIFVDTISGELAFLEQVEGFTGFYYGENELFTPSGKQAASGHVIGYQPGDIHAEKMTDCNLAKLESNLRAYDPANVFIHDVLDFSSRNHHNIKDPAFQFAQHIAGNTVAYDIKSVARVLEVIELAANNAHLHIVESNHDLAIVTWVKNADFKLDPVNALTYLRCTTALYNAIEGGCGASFNLLEWALIELGDLAVNDNKISFHKVDESLIFAGTEMGCHGHNGANGSKGSPKQFTKLGVHMNTGHTHSPSIYGPVWTSGVAASREMGYNIGPSGWMLADIVTYENGQRNIVFN